MEGHAMTKTNELNQVTRTGLYWPGKRTEVDRIALPFQVVETVNVSRATRETAPLLASIQDDTDQAWHNKLIWGENKYIMASLLDQGFAGKINLIYIDPPFATGQDFTVKMKVGDQEWTKEASLIEQKTYWDTWGKGIESYLQMMYDRLVLMRHLLAEDGSIYVHLDATVGHLVKVLLDAIFPGGFQREIIWRIGWVSGYKSAAKNWIRNHDTILFYVKTPGDFVFTKEYVPYPEGYKRRGGEEPTGPGYPIEDVWNANPFEFAFTGEDSLDSIQIKSFSREKTGFETQKNASIARRIIYASSNEGDLVGDFFCGSGTTGAVAEKLGRRWIMADLSRFAIQVSRKRLLDIPDCRPFEIMNLGKYERQYWQVHVNGEGAHEHEVLARYLDFIVQLYRGERVTGFAHLHGRKAGRMVHVGAVDAPITLSEINEALDECSANKFRGLDVLGWEWEMGLHDLVTAAARKRGVDLRLLTIPREVMDPRAVEAGDIDFYELAYLDVALDRSSSGFRVALRNFIIPNEDLVPQEVREKIKRWSDYVDFWAVDWDYQGDTFHNQWQSYRTRQHPALQLESEWHTYDEPGSYQVMVKVIDIFGNDTTKLLEVDAR
jgi:DNA modification methylase